MTKLTLREAILTTVNTRNGVNNVDLILNCMELFSPWFDDMDYVFQLAELVSSREIVELEFILFHMDYRIKSIYFPKGTKLYVNSYDKTEQCSAL